MTTKRFRVPTIAAAITVFMLSCGVSEGSPITVGFEFEAKGFSGFLGTLPPIDFVSGNFSFTFEDLGSAQILSPDTVNLTIAGFTYDVANTAVYIDRGIFVFGGLLGGPLSISSPSDDFDVIIDRMGPARYVDYSVPFSLDIYTSAASVEQIQQIPIPESNSLTLVALGGCAWLAANALASRLTQVRRTSSSGT